MCGNITHAATSKERMNSLKQITALLWVFGVGFAGLRADVIPPWQKRIQHTVRFTNAKGVTKYVLYIFPRDWNRNPPGNTSVRVPINGVVDINQLNPTAIHQAKGIYLFAIPIALHGPRDRLPDENWFTQGAKGIFKCEIPSYQIPSLPKSDPRDKVEDVYEIRGLPEKMELTRIETKDNAAAKPPQADRGSAIALASMSALAMVALVGYSRKSKR
jgi:hypothetical protein